MKDRLTDANSIVTLNNGETPTLAEYIAARGQGDTLTDFVATRDDQMGCYDVGDGRKIHPPKIGED